MERKSYLGLGIILAIFAALVSLMCIAFSYADVNDVNAGDVATDPQAEAVVGGEEQGEATEEAVTNDAWTITVVPQGISEDLFKKYCSLSVSGSVTWNPDTKTITLPADTISYEFGYYGETTEMLNMQFSTAEEGFFASITAQTLDPSKIEFVEWSGFDLGQSYSENKVINVVFKDLNPTYDSAVISGRVKAYELDTNAEGFANAPVVLAAENTGEVYLSTITNSNGEYTFNNVKPEWINDDNNPFTIYSSYPGCSVSSAWFNSDNPDRVEGNVAYFEDVDISLRSAEVNISGADHHQIFDIEMTIHRPDGDRKQILHLPFFGLRNNDMSKGAEVVVDNDGLITGTATTEIGPYTVTIDLKCQAVCDDGYKFSYIDLNGTKYNAGDPIVLDGVSEYTAVVNYEAVAQPENVTAQTGDAIPYAVVVGLGLVAIAAFVVARKQFN